MTRTGPTRPRRASVDRLFGTHAVAEALRARRRRIDLLRVRRAPWSPEIEAIVAAARRAGIPIREQSRETLDRLVPTGAKTQGVVLDAGPVPELSLRELLRATDSGSRRCLVALDGVEDPRNLGSILRVSEASGACGLLLARRRSPPLSPVVARSSAGALEHLPVGRVPNLVRALNLLKEQGFWVIGADAQGDRELFAVDDAVLSGDLVVVFGAEGRGLRPGVRSVLDHRIRIPLAGRVASLNVSAAAAVVLFEAYRRAGAGGPPRPA